MEADIEEQENTSAARPTKIRSFFSSLRHRALMCSSVDVIPTGEHPHQNDVEIASPSSAETERAADENEQGILRWFGVTDLRDPDIDNPDANDAYFEPKEDKCDGEDTSVVDEGADKDLVWEEKMWRKLYFMRLEMTPVSFRLHLVNMIKCAAKRDDLKSICLYMRQLQWVGNNSFQFPFLEFHQFFLQLKVSICIL